MKHLLVSLRRWMVRMKAAADFFLGYDASEYVPCVHYASENCLYLPLKFPEIY